MGETEYIPLSFDQLYCFPVIQFIFLFNEPSLQLPICPFFYPIAFFVLIYKVFLYFKNGPFVIFFCKHLI